MTSPANQQNTIPATNTPATTATSYASAAGAPKKPAQAPIVATGSQPPVVVGAPLPSAQNAKGASSSPVNGKPAVTPAVPAVVRGNLNGSDHARKSSVTMAATGPNSFVNGGPVGGAKSNIQFGFDSPAMAHSTPQTGSAAPIPIPGSNARVPSPAHSPSPIPQPSASGGRPPSGLQPASGQMTFGSLSSDGERHMRQGSVPPNAQPGSHFRRESGHSAQGDNAGAGRGNFQQGGRGRGGYNPNFNPQMGYPPNNLRAGPGQGRGSMAPNFTPQPRSMPYPNSPQLNRSPALVPSMPNTPNMAPAAMQPNMSMQTPPQYHYPPPMGGQHQQVNTPFFNSQPEELSFNPPQRTKGRRETEKSLQAGRLLDSTRERFRNDLSQRPRRLSKPLDQPRRDPDLNIARLPAPAAKVVAEQAPPTTGSSTRTASQSLDLSPEHGLFEYMLTLKNQNYGYPPQPQLDGYGRPVSMPYGYNNMNYMAPPQNNSPGYTPNYAAPPPYHQATHSMSRTPSQPERPSSANPQNQPVIVSSTPQPQHAQPKSVASNNFVMPRRSAAIQIKNLAGEVVDTSSFKAPASPSPSISHSKTPPVATSTPTPPPKSSTPSQAAVEKKTAKQIQDELKEKIKQATQAPQLAEEKAKKEKEEAEKVAAEKAAAEKAAAEKAAADKAAADKAAAEKAAAEKAATEALAKAEETKPAEEPKKEEPAPKAEEKPAEPVKAEAEKPAEPVKVAEPAKSAETEEEELERMIREMEEEDARREAAAAEYKKKDDIEKAAAKVKAEADRKKNAADEDRKLREQEREMERLEEEKEKRRAQGESKPLSVAEALAAARSGKEPKEADKVDSVADKLAGMKIGGKSSPLADQKPTTAEKRGAKPAALNLAPLNTKSVEPAQPSAALQSLKSARFLKVIDQEIYPAGIKSPNPALNAAVAKKGKTFKYDANFLLQFQKVFTEQPSLEFHQQVKSLIGDNDRSASSRGQTPSTRQPSRGSGFGGMGNFGAPGGRTLPPGTSSETRFAMANNPMARPPGNPIQSFRGPGGAFPGGANMSRTSSQSNMPNSPRQSSRSTRGGSRRDGYNTKDAQAAKNMPLTAGQDVKPIAITSTGWKPSSIGKAPNATPSGYLDPELVQRKVKAALNKMTPEKFDRIADQILEIASQSKDESDGRTLRQVIQLTFEKATDEAHWASMYAKFCKRMLETMSPDVRDERIKDKNGNVVNGGNLFRKYLLNRCQEEFERGWSTTLPEKPDEEAPKKPGEAVLMSDEYYVAAAAKRRGLGLVQFIGELYKLGMLTERIMHECVHKLVDYKGVPDETEIESLSKLLRTIGANLDATDKGKPLMDAYFQRIQNMVDMPELQSRMKFMLMDVIDLRRCNWHSKEANKGPKTLDEVRLEAEAAQAAKAQENARGNNRGGGRPQVGRGDARNFSAGYAQQTSNQVGMDDLRRLKGSANRTSSGNVTLGPTSMFSSRSNSGRRLGPGGSLGRPGEDSGASSRTGTPPTTTSHLNAFSLLANMETDHPASPPSTSVSPALSKVVPDDKKGGE